MPIKVPYEQILGRADAAGLKPDLSPGMIEQGAWFGSGWIAVKVNDDADEKHPNIFRIDGEFKAYEHIGPYKKIGAAYQQIKKDHPEAKEFYNAYMNSPKEVAESELRTLVCFR